MSVRRGCREVWRPLDSKSLQIERRGNLDELGLRATLNPADDPENFVLGWDVWDDWPYSKMDLIDGEDTDDKSFGPPAYTVIAEGDDVRNAYLLNDSFQLAHAGAATVTDRQDVKDFLGKYHEMLAKLGAGPEEMNPAAAASAYSGGPSFADQVFAELISVPGGRVGAQIHQAQGHRGPVEHLTAEGQLGHPHGHGMDWSIQSNGYRTSEVFGWMKRMEESLDDN